MGSLLVKGTGLLPLQHHIQDKATHLSSLAFHVNLSGEGRQINSAFPRLGRGGILNHLLSPKEVGLEDSLRKSQETITEFLFCHQQNKQAPLHCLINNAKGGPVLKASKISKYALLLLVVLFSCRRNFSNVFFGGEVES